MLVVLEILLLLGAILLPLVPRKAKNKTSKKTGRQKPVALSNYVVTPGGHLEEISDPYDRSLL